MPYERSTLSEITSRIQTDIETRIIGSSLLRKTIYRILARIFSGAIHLLYSYIGYEAEQKFIQLADEQGLENNGQEYGIYKDSAEYATGQATTSGTSGITITSETELQTDDGFVFTVDDNVIISGGTATLDLTASEAGSDGNQVSGTTLTFVSPIPGVSNTATVTSDAITGGTDEETPEEYRSKLQRRRQYPPFGGCQHDYVQWMLEYPGVTRAWCFPNYLGVTSDIGLAFMMDNETTPIPDATIRSAVEDYIIEHVDPVSGRTVGCPATAEPGLTMIALSANPMNIEIAIYPYSTTVQTAIDAELEDLIIRKGGSGQTIYVSDIQAALGLVSVLERWSLTSPSSNTYSSYSQVHTLGTTTYTAL
jgi:uncharacterized phage protein gp47/JayE